MMQWLGVGKKKGGPLKPSVRLDFRKIIHFFGASTPPSSTSIPKEGTPSVYLDGPMGLAMTQEQTCPSPASPLAYDRTRSTVLAFSGYILNARELRKTYGLETAHEHPMFSDSAKVKADAEAPEHDADVVLQLYEKLGTRCVEKLIGGFSFALWDCRKNQFILGRDRIGLKPLYWIENSDQVVFSTRIKQVLAFPEMCREFNWASFLKNSNSISGKFEKDGGLYFSGVQQVPPGSLQIFSLDSGTSTQLTYWTPPFWSEGTLDSRSEEEISSEYLSILRKSVQQNLNPESSEFGLLGSGGMDSTTIAALAEGRLHHSYTHLSRMSFHNKDAEFAHFVSRKLGLTQHMAFRASDTAPCSPQEWKSLLWAAETPGLTSHHVLFHLHRLAREAQPHLRGLLTGIGSDEFNGGHSGTITSSQGLEANWDAYLAHLDKTERNSYLNSEFLLLQSVLPDGTPIIQKDCLHKWRREKDEFLHLAWNRIVRRNLDRLSWYLHLSERASGISGNEIRYPFLHHELIEFCAKIPPTLHSKLLWNKLILRNSARPFIPREIYDRPRLAAPAEEWKQDRLNLFKIMTSHDRQLFVEAFGSREGDHPVLSLAAINKIMDATQEDPDRPLAGMLLSLMNASLLEQMIEKLGREVHLSAEASTLPSPSEIRLLPDRQILDWEKESQSLLQALMPQEVPESEVDREQVLSFAPETLMVKDNSLVKTDGDIFISVKLELKYILDDPDIGPWVEILKRIDGTKTLNSLLNEAQIDYSMIAKHLREALNEDVVRLGCVVEK